MRKLFPCIPILALCACSGSDPVVDPDRSYLTEEQRLWLFDLERGDYLLGMALKPLNRAIAAGDGAAILEELAGGFRCELPALPGVMESVPSPFWHAHLEGAEETDAEGFVRWIDDLCGRFSKLETVSFARYQNSAEIIAGPGAVAESEGSFRFAGRTRAGGLAEMYGTFRLRHNGFERLEDGEQVEDHEVRVDHWIHDLDLSDVSFVVSSGPLFEDVTAACGVDATTLYDNWDHKNSPVVIFTGGVYLGDVNGDGHLDLLVTELLNSRLYWGQGDGSFTASGWEPEGPVIELPDGRKRVLEPYAAIFDATGNGKVDVLHAGKLYTWSAKRGEMVQLRATSLPNADASLCDYDRDGLVDIHFTNSGPYAKKRQENMFFDDDKTNGRKNQLFKNLGGGRFQNVTRPSNASPSFGRTFTAVWFHANEDDWPDLFDANEFGRNDFLVNNGDGTFREVDDVDPVFGGFSMGATAGDMDGDGRVDLYLSNMYSKAGQRVYHHLDLSIYPENARRMFIASVTGNRLYHARGDLTFENTSAYAGGYAVGWGFSGAMFDVDLDGWLDLYAPCGYISIDRSKPDG